MGSYDVVVDEMVRDGIREAEERFEEIESDYREDVRQALDEDDLDASLERLENAEPDFEEATDALDTLISQLLSSLADLEFAKEELEDKATEIEAERQERVEALEEALEELEEEEV